METSIVYRKLRGIVKESSLLVVDIDYNSYNCPKSISRALIILHHGKYEKDK